MDYQTIYIQVYCSLLQAFYNKSQQSGYNKSQQSEPTLMAQQVSSNKTFSNELDEKITELADFHTRQILKRFESKDY
jgi:hypothetical protein